jgi:CheY-like chemotaxis protein
MVDMLLPDGDGTEFTRQVRTRGFTGPIIMISGYAIQGEREACFAADCTDFLVKPVEVSTFIDLFKRYDVDGVQ